MRIKAHLRWAWIIGVATGAVALPIGMLAIDPLIAAPPKGTQQVLEDDEASTLAPAGLEPEGSLVGGSEKKHMIRLNYVDVGWDKVLKDFARVTETELVVDHIPSKKYSRWDFKRYSKTDALRILNQELEPQNFRLQFKGKFLVLNQLREFRHEYPAALLRGEQRQGNSDEATDSREETASAGSASRAQKTASRSAAKKGTASRTDGRGGSIQQVSAEEAARPETGRVRRDSQSAPVEIAVQLRTRDAGPVASHIYRAFGREAEKIDDGPQGLRGFRVRGLPSGNRAGEGKSPTPVQFSVGVDKDRNELIVAAPQPEAKSIVKLIKTLDNVPRTADGTGTARIVKTKKDAGKLATALQPELDRLAQATRKVSRSAKNEDEDAVVQDADEDMPARRTPGQADGENQGGERSLFGSLKADVLVESVPELGILVIRGNQSDVEAVEKVIEEIERLSVQTAPRVQLALLHHISSEALASLLTSVYERLAGARNSAVQQSQAISVFPVSRPNAVLIVASNADIDAVFALINELDQQTDPATEFMVYRLKHAVPSKVVDAIEALYPPPTATGAAANNQTAVGLAPRVKVIDDLRTNSVIVQARPRDLKEVERLIDELDSNDKIASRHKLQIFKLTYAVADEVSYTLSTAIQNVLAPSRASAAPTAAQGGQGQFGGQQAAASQSQGASDLKEVKSTILEFLATDGERARELRSGILSDIRMTPDFRTNSIVVTAPAESMDLVGTLIHLLDQPPAQVAEIKVFKLKNGDATSMQTLLERLFGIQRTGQQGGQQQGGQGGQGGVPGLLVADAEDSSSMLIPLRFSTDVRTNSIIAIGGAAALDVVGAVLLNLDQSDIRQRQNEVYRLKNAPATNVATAISNFLQTQQQALTQDPGILSPFEQIEREVIVVPEATSNSLLISATPRYFDDIHELIVKLDRAPRQVLIQALIVEVTLNNTDEFGMEFGLQDSVLFRRSSVSAPTTVATTVQSPNGNQTQTQNIISETGTPGYLFNNQTLGNNTFAGASNPANLAGQVGSFFNTALANSTLGYGGLIMQAGSQNINFLLRALAARTRVDVLSRPQIRTVDNQLAQIQVGQEVPRINGFSQNGTAGSIVPTVQQRSIGIILQVIPRISPEGLVIMEIVARKDALSAQSVSLGQNAVGGAVTSPIINTTNAQTVIGVNSGQTVILGGMITKNDTLDERKVPVLGDIPVLGRAFRYDLKQMTRTELLIFLTPRIINDDDEAEMFKQIEMERLNFIESDAERIHGPLFGMPPAPAKTAPPSPSMDKQKSGNSSGPSLPPEPRIKSTNVPPPDPAEPSRPSTSRSLREPHPMPINDADLKETSGMPEDDEDDDDDDVTIPVRHSAYRAGRPAEAAVKTRAGKSSVRAAAATKAPKKATSTRPRSEEVSSQQKSDRGTNRRKAGRTPLPEDSLDR